MPLDPTFYFHTVGDGVFGDTTVGQLERALAKIGAAGGGVIHLHGGLVDKESGIAKAERLKPVYEAAGVHPLFAVWESGLLETITNNLTEIAGEKIFRTLLRQLLKWVAGKLAGGVAKTPALPFPNDLEVKREQAKLAKDQLPFASVAAPAGLAHVTPQQQDAFVDALTRDPDFQREVRAIVLTHSKSLGSSDAERSALVAAGEGVTRLDSKIVDELRNANEDGRRALISGLTLARHAARVFARVIRRFVEKRDHGVYTTVVEELLREVYLDDVGALVWGSMKKDTQDTFEGVGKEPARAGWMLVRKLGELYQSGEKPPISVVAHSAGSIYACHLLEAIHEARSDPAHPLPEGFRLRNLIFLAPAVRFDAFDRVLALPGGADLFERFRMFTLKDEIESGYWEIPGVYPRSLLYLVSGVVERKGDDSDFDCPLVGMQRYYDTARYPQAELRGVQEFVGKPGHAVWSKTQEPIGAATTAAKHGDFDSDETTLKSVSELLR